MRIAEIYRSVQGEGFLRARIPNPGSGSHPRVPAGRTVVRGSPARNNLRLGRAPRGSLAEIRIGCRLDWQAAGADTPRRRGPITGPSAPGAENRETMEAETRLGP